MKMCATAGISRHIVRLLLPLIPIFALAAETPQPRVILIVGPPGSGKTTQAKNLSRKFGVPSISMADLLKRSAGWGKEGSRRQSRAAIESGELVNDQVADELIRERLLRKDTQRGFILDGYPWTAKQADNLDAILKELQLPPPLVVQLDVPDAIAVERMRTRRRADDTPATIERRLSEYHQEASAVLDRYRSDRMLLVDATRSEQEVWKTIEAGLDARKDRP